MSQRDRSSDGIAIRLGIANRSQTIAVSAPETEAAAERSLLVETLHHGVQLVEGEPRHGMMPLRAGFAS